MTLEDILKQTYAVNLTHNEIQIILLSLDEYIDNHENLMSGRTIELNTTTVEQTIASIQNKLEPIHAKHARMIRKKLFESNEEVE